MANCQWRQMCVCVCAVRLVIPPIYHPAWCNGQNIVRMQQFIHVWCIGSSSSSPLCQLIVFFSLSLYIHLNRILHFAIQSVCWRRHIYQLQSHASSLHRHRAANHQHYPHFSLDLCMLADMVVESKTIKIHIFSPFLLTRVHHRRGNCRRSHTELSRIDARTVRETRFLPLQLISSFRQIEWM